MIARVAAQLAHDKRAQLDTLKAEHHQLSRPDFLWHYLLQSFATMGRATGWKGLIGTPTNYRRLTYNALANLPSSERLQQVEETCRAAKVRMPSRKAKFIVACFDCITKMGGPEAAKDKLLSAAGETGRSRFSMRSPASATSTPAIF
ncbi:MAG TPA: hypothetical protein VK993_01730 [Chthoniobacterales bacterium]|nr:hypothetical protein [Chthoniobacterales bacterium]